MALLGLAGMHQLPWEAARLVSAIAAPVGFGIWAATRWPMRVQRRPWRADATALASLWAGGTGLVAGVLAWPFSAGAGAMGLPAALGLGAAVAGLWTVHWRYWPLLAASQREGGGLTRWTEAVPGSWAPLRGFLLGGLLLATQAIGAWAAIWADANLRLPVVLVFGGLSLLAAWALQRHGQEPSPPVLPAPTARPGRWRSPDPLPPAADAEDAEATDPVELLYAAARSGRIEAALTLMAEGIDPRALPDPSWADQRSLPMLAALLPDLRLLRALIGHGVDVNQPHAGLTPLLACTRDSWHGRVDAVTMLLANGADPRQTDRHGDTALHHAARSTDPGVAAALLDAGADVAAVNLEGRTPLVEACAAGNWRLAKFLLERGATPNAADALPALHAAAATDDDDAAGVRLLLKHKARIDATDARGRTALHEAIAAGHADIIRALLDAHARADIADADGLTAFLEAARARAPEGLGALGASRVQPGAIDAQGRNAVALACAAGVEPSRLAALLALGCDPECRDLAGRRPLEHALGGGHWALVGVLDPGYPIPSGMVEAMDGDSLQAPVEDVLCRYLRGGDWNAATTLRSSLDALALGRLLAEFADAEGAAAFAWLLRAGADTEAWMPNGESLWMRLLRGGASHLPGLWFLARAGRWPQGAGHLARWLHAAGAGVAVEDYALAAFAAGVDGFARLPSGDAALPLAVQRGHRRLVGALLDAGVDPNQRDANGSTALHHAVLDGDEATVRRLLLVGAAPLARSSDGQTPLGMALARNRRELVPWLDWSPWPLPARRLLPSDLPGAAMAGDFGAVARLLALGLPIDAIDAQGCTALLRAAGGGHAAIVRHLLDAGADPAIRARTGATALSAAISMQRPEVVDLLLGHGVSPEQPMPGGVTPLMLACALGLPELASRLLRAGAQVDAMDAQGLRALHCVALFAFGSREIPRVLALLDQLLLAGASADARDADGRSSLALALGARAEQGAVPDESLVHAVVERLLAEGIPLSEGDSRGATPLHLAAQHGLPRVVRRLLAAGADAEQRDRLGRRPVEVAIQRGLVDVAAELSGGTAPPSAATPSLARFLRPREP